MIILYKLLFDLKTYKNTFFSIVLLVNNYFNNLFQVFNKIYYTNTIVLYNIHNNNVIFIKFTIDIIIMANNDRYNHRYNDIMAKLTRLIHGR